MNSDNPADADLFSSSRQLCDLREAFGADRLVTGSDYPSKGTRARLPSPLGRAAGRAKTLAAVDEEVRVANIRFCRTSNCYILVQLQYSILALLFSGNADDIARLNRCHNICPIVLAIPDDNHIVLIRSTSVAPRSRSRSEYFHATDVGISALPPNFT